MLPMIIRMFNKIIKVRDNMHHLIHHSGLKIQKLFRTVKEPRIFTRTK